MVINMGNIFAKKTDLGDNCFSFNDFLNKQRDFACGMENPGIRLIPAEKVSFFKHVLQSKNIEGFFGEVLRERHGQGSHCR